MEWHGTPTLHLQGLIKHIKDNLLHFLRFQKLSELWNYALEWDSRCWERKEYDALTPCGSQPTNRPSSSNNQSSGSNKNCNKTNKGSANSSNNSTLAFNTRPYQQAR